MKLIKSVTAMCDRTAVIRVSPCHGGAQARRKNWGARRSGRNSGELQPIRWPHRAGNGRMVAIRNVSDLRLRCSANRNETEGRVATCRALAARVFPERVRMAWPGRQEISQAPREEGAERAIQAGLASLPCRARRQVIGRGAERSRSRGKALRARQGRRPSQVFATAFAQSRALVVRAEEHVADVVRVECPRAVTFGWTAVAGEEKIRSPRLPRSPCRTKPG